MNEGDAVFANYLQGKSQEAYLEEQRQQRLKNKELIFPEGNTPEERMADYSKKDIQKTKELMDESEFVRALEDARELPSALVDLLEEAFRQARAYGWEIGNGAEWSGKLNLSDENPFRDRFWIRNIYEAERQRGSES